MIGTSDQSCWLAEACKILLLLLTIHAELPCMVHKAFLLCRLPKRASCYPPMLRLLQGLPLQGLASSQCCRVGPVTDPRGTMPDNVD